MSGYRADLAAIAAAGRALRDPADTVRAARDQLDIGVCATVGPGRLRAVAAALTEDSRRDLDQLHHTLVEDTDLTSAAIRAYTDLDQTAAHTLTPRTHE